jgi:signal transduction histidine kinase
MVEDSAEDAGLILRELRRGGFAPDFERVFSREALEAALDRGPWDLITADYSMPQFTGVEAFEVVRAKNLDVPFIIVSGTVGEQAAVAAMKAGVQDFVLKDKLDRLVPVIERELRDAQVRAEREKMREQLLVADRMASVGMLAASVAHEINNPLTSIAGNLELITRALLDLSRTIPAIAPLLEDLNDAQEGARRIQEIARDLKLFSRAPAEVVEAVDLRRVFESSLRMARNEIQHRARVVRDYGDVPPVEANESRLGQVFLNLIINAAQSIAVGHADNNEIRVATRRDNQGQVIAEVEDTGSGMAPEVLAQIFTPLFTTKPVGVGTGLGLAICRRIISDIGAEISVESEVGKGSLFRITFPRIGHTADLTVESVVAVHAARRRGRILVVDDEPMISKIIRRVCARDHDVVSVESAREALARIERGERFDLILSDVMMPAMTGPQLYEELKRVAPDLAQSMVFFTGGSFASDAQASLDGIPNLRIEKPFAIDHLHRIINERIH